MSIPAMAGAVSPRAGSGLGLEGNRFGICHFQEDKLATQCTNDAKSATSLYSVMRSVENSIGGGEGVDGLYGSITLVRDFSNMQEHSRAPDTRWVDHTRPVVVIAFPRRCRVFRPMPAMISMHYNIYTFYCRADWFSAPLGCVGGGMHARRQGCPGRRGNGPG